MAFRIQSHERVYGKRLGAGGFGEVFQAKWDHTDVAVKQLPRLEASDFSSYHFLCDVSRKRELQV